jgi:hypothetical protein
MEAHPFQDTFSGRKADPKEAMCGQAYMRICININDSFNRGEVRHLLISFSQVHVTTNALMWIYAVPRTFYKYWPFYGWLFVRIPSIWQPPVQLQAFHFSVVLSSKDVRIMLIKMP